MLGEKEIMTSSSMTTGMNPAAHAEGQRLPTSPQIIGSRTPRSWDGWLAALISNAGSPPILACFLVALTALKHSSARAWVWGGVYVLLGVLVPLLYLVWLVMQGQVTDIQVQLRKQRAQPLLVTITCTGLAWLMLTLGLAPRVMVILAGALWLQAVAVFAITLRWKVSLHAATAAGAMAMVWVFLGTALPLLLIVPLVAWSRVRLRRHTIAQTIVGALLGFVIFFAAAMLTSSG